MANYTATGTIVVKGEREVKSEKLTARQLVISVKDGAYEQFYNMQMLNDRCDLLDGFSVGQTVEVSFNITGREYNGRYFSNINAWKIAANIQSEPAPTQPEPAAYVTDDTPDDTPDSDLPF